jgi:hypothetical protein
MCHYFLQALDEVALEEKLDDDSEESEKEVSMIIKYNKQENRSDPAYMKGLKIYQRTWVFSISFILKASFCLFITCTYSCRV